MQRKNGFSLIELLIVIAIILIIAAIAIPNLLRARISANEASAAASVQTIKTSEVAYSTAYPTVGYAASLANLGGGASPCIATAATACLVDNFLATAIAPPGKSGYVFSAMGIPNGPTNSAYVIGAIPVTFGSTGIHLFCAADDGLLHSSPVAGAMPVTVAACEAFPPAQ